MKLRPKGMFESHCTSQGTHRPGVQEVRSKTKGRVTFLSKSRGYVELKKNVPEVPLLHLKAVGAQLRAQLARHQDDIDLWRKVVHLPKLVLTHEAHFKTL